MRVLKKSSFETRLSQGGTVTPANSSSISDGAALILSSNSYAETGPPYPGEIVGHASHAQEPGWFTALFPAQKLLDRTGWGKDDVDLWEVNEAFAVITWPLCGTWASHRIKSMYMAGPVHLGTPLVPLALGL